MRKRILRNIAITGFVALAVGFNACKDDSSPEPNGNNNNTTTYDPYLKYDFKGVNYETKTFVADYGSKIYITGFGSSGSILMDMALRLQKDEIKVNVPFSLDASGELSTAIFYVNSDQWMIGNGSFSVTEHANNRLSGTFSGKAYQIEYAGQDPVIVDSAQLTNGVFNDIKISD